MAQTFQWQWCWYWNIERNIFTKNFRWYGWIKPYSGVTMEHYYKGCAWRIGYWKFVVFYRKTKRSR